MYLSCISHNVSQLYDGLELYIAKVQSMDDKGLAKKCGLKERDQILQVYRRCRLSHCVQWSSVGLVK